MGNTNFLQNKEKLINTAAHAMKIAVAVGAPMYAHETIPVVIAGLITSGLAEGIDVIKELMIKYLDGYPAIKTVLKKESAFCQTQVQIIIDEYAKDENYVIPLGWNTSETSAEFMRRYSGSYSEKEWQEVESGLSRYLQAVKAWVEKKPEAIGEFMKLIDRELKTHGIEIQKHAVIIQQQEADIQALRDNVTDVNARVEKKENQNTSISLPKILTNTSVAYADEQVVLHREKEIEDLERMLSAKKSVLLMKGFGGIGKSALARVIYSKMVESDQYDHIGWIQYEENLKQSMMKAIILPASIEQQIKTPEERWEAIQRLLKSDTDKKLLIIDNVDKDASIDQDPEQDSELREISNWNQMTVLLTSRLPELSGYASYELGYLTEENGMDLFYYYYARNTEYQKPMEQRKYQQEVRTLVVELAGSHTYAIELLAKSAGKRKLTDYIQNIRETGFKFPKVKVLADHRHSSAVMAEQLQKLFDLNKRSEEEQKCAWNFAVLPVNTQLSQDEAEDWFGCDSTALVQLESEGWLSGEEGYVMHPLVRDTVWLYGENNMAPKGSAEMFIEYLVNNSEKFYDQTILYSDYQHRLSLADYVISKIELPPDGRKIYIYHNMANGLRFNAQYEKAEEYYQKALQIGEQVLGKEHPFISTTYNDLALLYHAQGEYQKAKKYCLKALQINEQVLGKDHPSAAIIYHNLAGLYQDLGEYMRKRKHIA